MVWNKTPDEKVKAILIALEDIDKSLSQIAEELEVSVGVVGDICRKYCSKEVRKLRYSAACRKGKLGTKNPMYGKTGFKHHNAVDEVRVSGYKTVFHPDWWLGVKHKGTRVYEHHIVWAKSTGNNHLPQGYVIHHKDLNIDNNDPSNLELMTISDHMKLHAAIRKVQRLGGDPVGNSVPEAHSPAKAGDDIV